MKKIFSLLLLGTLGFASAQTLTPTVKKSIDAQAYAFTKQHCTEKYTSKPARAIPADRFPFLVKLLDSTFEQVKKEHPEMTFRSDNNGKDMYRAQIGKRGEGSGFIVAYLNKGQMYTYGCELR